MLQFLLCEFVMKKELLSQCGGYDKYLPCLRLESKGEINTMKFMKLPRPASNPILKEETHVMLVSRLMFMILRPQSELYLINLYYPH